MAPLESAAYEVLRSFGPAWTLDRPRFWRDGDRLCIRGALPSTMHFGAMTIDLATGRATFVDEDHRDCADLVEREVALPEELVVRLRALAA